MDSKSGGMLWASLLALAAVIAAGTGGYMYLEGWSLTDSLYMTVSTLASIGFKEVHALDQKGRFFTFFLIIAGVMTVVWTAGNAFKLLLKGQIVGYFRNKGEAAGGEAEEGRKAHHEGVGEKLWVSLSALLVVLCAGTGGYMYIEGWELLDSLYMTVITLTTIGFMEVHDLDQAGRMFTVCLILFGVGTAAWSVRNATKLMLEGELREIFGRRKVEQKIRKLKDHYIVCGFGRMGRLICRELARKPVPFVIVERNADYLTPADWERYLVIIGDADKDDVLVEAGIQKAKGLIAVVSTDADNLYIVLSARGLNPDLFIVARAGDDGSEKKLIRAGASKVISPYTIGADRMAQAVLRPTVVDFLEFATHTSNLDLMMEEVVINTGSRLSGLALKDCGIRQDLGIIILAIKKSDGQMEFNPSPVSVLREGDCLIAMGQPDRLKALEEITMGNGGNA